MCYHKSRKRNLNQGGLVPCRAFASSTDRSASPLARNSDLPALGVRFRVGRLTRRVFISSHKRHSKKGGILMKSRILIPVLALLLCAASLASCQKAPEESAPPLVAGNFSQTEDGLWTNDLITITATPSESATTVKNVQLEFRNDTDFEVSLRVKASGFNGVETCNNGQWSEASFGAIHILHIAGGDTTTFTVKPHSTLQYRKSFTGIGTNYRNYWPLSCGTYRLRFLVTFDQKAEVEQHEVWAITYVTVTPAWASAP